jgi:biotin operon repressor
MPVSRLAHYRADDPYTRVPNSAVRDRRLDLKARGLLLMMLSKPDGWRFTERNLADEANVSRQQVRTAMETLTEAGYVVRERVTRDGRPVLETRVYDVPSEGTHSVPSEGPHSVPTLVSDHDRREVGPYSKTEVSKTDKERAARAPDHLFDAVIAACGHDARRLTPSERGRVNRALKDLRAVNATPDEVRRFASRWPKIYPGATMTATAIAANWTTVLGGVTASSPTCPTCKSPLDHHDADWCRAAYGGNP